MTDQEELNEHFLAVAKQWNIEAMLTLLAQGVDIETKSEVIGFTALLLTSWNGHNEAVRALLDRGANVEAKDVNGETALLSAATRGHLETVIILLIAGANIEAQNNNGATALHIASKFGDSKIVTVLLNAGANPDAMNKRSETALMLAHKNNHVKTVDLLNCFIEKRQLLGAIKHDSASNIEHTLSF